MKDYIEEQDEFIRKNKLKVGDKIIVHKKVDSYYSGWNNTWVGPMDRSIGKKLKIAGLESSKSGITLDNGCRYPYHAFMSSTTPELYEIF